MDYDALLGCFRQALTAIDQPRFFETERGFQGELRAKLEASQLRELLPQGAILEQEYQKRLDTHGLKIRPDLIIHEPFDPARHSGRQQGNHAVIELKLRASQKRAEGDFKSLLAMMEVLEYPFGIFINIDSQRTHARCVPAEGHGRIVCFAVWLQGNQPQVMEERP